MKPSIAIILVNWNGYKDTLECLTSLQTISYNSYQIIVVDNGSTDPSLRMIKEKFPDLNLIATHANLGFAGGNNVAIRYALAKKYDFLFLLNNDTIVSPHLLEELVLASQLHEKGGIFGTKVLRYSDPTIIDHLGGIWNPSIAEFLSPFSGCKDAGIVDMQQVDYVSGCAFFVKRKVFETIGLLDERFFLIWEESDFCFRAKQVGFEIWTVPQAKIWHKISSSFSGKPHLQYYWWRNRLLWIEKNCSKKERLTLYLSPLLKEIFHSFKIHFLKKIQYLLCQIFFPKNITKKKREKLLRYRASCQGIRDYCFRRFGKGPDWLAEKKDPSGLIVPKNGRTKP